MENNTLKRHLHSFIQSSKNPRGRLSSTHGRNLLGTVELALQDHKTSWRKLGISKKQFVKAISRVSKKERKKAYKKANVRL